MRGLLFVIAFSSAISPTVGRAQARRAPGPLDAIVCLRFSPKSDEVIGIHANGQFRHWELATGKMTAGLVKAPGQNKILLSPDQKWIVSAGHPGAINLFDAQSGKKLGMLKGHERPITGLAVSPDSSCLASGDESGQVRLWNVASQTTTHVLEVHQKAVFALAFSPDGKRLASGGRDRTVQLWDAEQGTRIKQFEGPAQWAAWAQFSPSGEQLYTAGWSRDLIVWDTARTAYSHTIKLHETPSALELSPDGTRMFVGSCGEELNSPPIPDSTRVEGKGFLWDLEQQSLEYELPGHQARISDACFSRDGTRLATGSDDREIRIWNVADGKLDKIISPRSGAPAKPTAPLARRHPGAILTTAQSADGTKLATAGDDGAVRVWELPSLKELCVLKEQSRGIAWLRLSPDGEVVATAESKGPIRLHNARNAELLHEFPPLENGIHWLDFCSSGKELLVAERPGSITIWSLETGAKLRSFSNPDLSDVCGLIQRGSRAVSQNFLPNAARTFVIWKVETGEVTSTVDAPGDWIPPLLRGLLFSRATDKSNQLLVYDMENDRTLPALNPAESNVPPVVSTDGRYAAIPEYESFTLYDLRTGYFVARIVDEDHRRLRPLAFTPDGQSLVSIQAPGTLMVSSVASLVESNKLAGHSGVVASLAKSHDGRRLATGGDDGRMIVWDAPTGRPLLFCNHHACVRSIEFSADDRWILTTAAGLFRASPGEVCLWEASSGKLSGHLLEETDAAPCAAFSADGQRAFLSDGKGELREWSLADGAFRRSIDSHTANCVAVAASPDGKLLATGYATGLIELSDANTLELVGTLQGHANRVCALGFSANCEFLASADADGVVKVWNVKDRSAREIFSQAGQTFRQLTFSPSGSTLGGSCISGFMALWSLPGGEARVFEQDPRLGPVLAHSFLYQGNDEILYAGTAPPRSFSTNSSSGKWAPYRQPSQSAEDAPLAQLKGHASRVDWLSFTSDGQYLVSRDVERTLKIWKATDWSLARSLASEEKNLALLALSPDGRTLATTVTRLAPKEDPAPQGPNGEPLPPEPPTGIIQLWNLDTGESSHPFEDVVGEVTALSFSADGGLLVTGSRWIPEGTEQTFGHVQLWDMRALRQDENAVDLNAGIEHVAHSPGGKRLVVVATRPDAKLMELSVWDTQSWKRLSKRRFLANWPWKARQLVFSADGRYLAFPTADLVQESAPTGEVVRSRATKFRLTILDLVENREVKESFANTTSMPTDAVFINDGAQLVLDNSDDFLRVWRLSDETLERKLNSPLGSSAIALSPDGRLLIKSGALRLTCWETSTWRSNTKSIGGAPLAFSADSRFLAVVNENRINILPVTELLAP